MTDLHGFLILKAIVKPEFELARYQLAQSDPHRFFDFCQENQLAGFVYTCLKSDHERAIFPGDVRSRFKYRYFMQWQRNEKFVQELGRISTRFESAGIEFLVLKGPHLASRFYGNIDRREAHDIDLMVRPRDFDHSRRLLRELGFAPESGVTLTSHLLFRFVHHVEFHNDGIPLDLHHQLRTHIALRLDYDRIWASKCTIALNSHSFLGLADTYCLVTQILTIHQDISLGTITVRPFVDLYMILRKIHDSLSWDDFFSERDHEGCLAIAANVLAMFLIVFECDGEFPALTATVKKHEQLWRLRADRLKYFHLLGNSTLAEKKRWAFQQYACGTATAKVWWIAGLPVWLVIYHKTFFRGLTRRLGGRSGAQSAHRDWNVDYLLRNPLRLTDDAMPYREGRFRFGSLSAHIIYENETYIDMIEDLFRLEFHRCSDAGSKNPPDIRLCILDVDDETIRNDPWVIRRNHSDGFKPIFIRRELEDVTIIYYDAVAAHIFRREQHTIIVMPIMSRGESRDYILHSVMVVMYRLLYCFRRIHLHAAGIQMGATTNMFFGHNGSGKSTMSLRLGQAGAVVLAEDHVVLRRKEGQFFISGCDGKMRVTAATEKHFFPEKIDCEWKDFAGVKKKEIRLSDHVTAAPYEDRGLDRIFFPHIGDVFEITPITSDDAFARITEVIHERYRFFDSGDRDAFDQFIRDLTASTQVFDLTLSRNLQDLDALAEFLQSKAP